MIVVVGYILKNKPIWSVINQKEENRRWFIQEAVYAH